MEDFVQRWGPRAAEAQATGSRQQEARDELDSERLHALARLKAHVQQRAEQADSGGLDGLSYYCDQSNAPGAVSYQFNWLAPLPRRGVWVRVEEPAGRVSWGWRVSQAATGWDPAEDTLWHEVDPRQLTPEALDTLISGLADQEAWVSGHPPAVDLPGA